MSNINNLDHSGSMVAGVVLSYEMLIGEEEFTEVNKQANYSVLF